VHGWFASLSSVALSVASYIASYFTSSVECFIFRFVFFVEGGYFSAARFFSQLSFLLVVEMFVVPLLVVVVVVVLLLPLTLLCLGDLLRLAWCCCGPIFAAFSTPFGSCFVCFHAV
jgi:hypothetical protein